MRAFRKRGIMAAGCLCLTVLFLWMGNVYENRAAGYFKHISIQAEAQGFETEWIHSAIGQNENREDRTEEPREGETFAAWTELKDQTLSVMKGEKAG